MSLSIHTCLPHQAPLPLLLEADPDLSKIRHYLANGLCRVAQIDGMTVGVCVLQVITPDLVELINIAVDPARQGQGIGRALLADAIAQARQLGARRLELGTGTFGHPLTFYQRAGFRVVAVEPDYFLAHYAEPLFENGLQHKDRLRLALAL